MKISICRRGEAGAGYEGGISPGALVVSHGEHLIPWAASPFDRTELQDNGRIFDGINGYWARLTHQRQGEIFEVYLRIKELMDNFGDFDDVAYKLLPLVKQLIDDYHPFDEVQYWVNNYGNYHIPENVLDSTTFERGSPTTEEKTYFKEDYRNLVAMSTVLHVMVPIWGEFIFRTKDDTGTTFKEYYAYMLLGQSKILECKAMKKLLKYVEHQLPANGSSDAAILKGISREDYPTWMLARVLVRRVSICDITGNIIKVVFQYIRQKNSGQKSGGARGSGFSMSDVIRAKYNDSNSGDDESNHSILEGYMIQNEVSTGDVKTIVHYLNNPYFVARKIEPDISPGLVAKCVESVQVLMAYRPQPVQITLVAWTLKDAVYPRAYELLGKFSILNAIAITQAILLHRHQLIMAAFVGAIVIEEVDEFRLTGSESKGKLSRELADKLDIIYPFRRRIGPKKSAKLVNPVIVDIDVVTKALGEAEWKITLPDQCLLEFDPPLISRIFVTPFDIRNVVAQMIIGINKGEAL